MNKWINLGRQREQCSATLLQRTQPRAVGLLSYRRVITRSSLWSGSECHGPCPSGGSSRHRGSGVVVIPASDAAAYRHHRLWWGASSRARSLHLPLGWDTPDRDRTGSLTSEVVKSLQKSNSWIRFIISQIMICLISASKIVIGRYNQYPSIFYRYVIDWSSLTWSLT